MPEGTVVLLPQDHLTWLLFYALGFLGVVIKFGKEMLARGTSFAVVKTYLHDNGLVVALHFITYTGLIAIWLTTDIFAFAGGYKGILNAMTIVFGYGAQMIFDKAVPRIAERLSNANGTRSPNSGS